MRSTITHFFGRVGKTGIVFINTKHLHGTLFPETMHALRQVGHSISNHFLFCPQKKVGHAQHLVTSEVSHCPSVKRLYTFPSKHGFGLCAGNRANDKSQKENVKNSFPIHLIFYFKNFNLPTNPINYAPGYRPAPQRGFKRRTCCRVVSENGRGFVVSCFVLDNANERTPASTAKFPRRWQPIGGGVLRGFYFLLCHVRIL